MIRDSVPSDLEAILEVHRKAFKGNEAELVRRLVENGKSILSLVAVRNGRVTGHILFTEVALVPPSRSLLGLAPLAVLPEFQGQGIGTQLAEAGVARCRNLQVDGIVVLGDPRYYSRFGFCPAAAFGLENEYGAGDAFQFLPLREGEFHGIVRYAPEFAAADADALKSGSRACQNKAKSTGAPMPSFREGLSFDDVLLIPKRTQVLPSEVDTSTTFLKGLTLRIPIVSAPMDTVTDARLAIAVAREGGVGVIHRNMTIDQQAEQVDRVKRSESGVITNPIKLEPDNSLREAVELMERFHISGVPIVNKDGRLVGILTNRDIRFESEFDKPISCRMTSVNLVTASVGTTLDQAEAILAEHRIEKLPIVDKDFHLQGLITIKDIQKVKRHPMSTKDSKGRLAVGAAIGALREPYERAKALKSAGADFVVIDAAHGHSKGVMDCVKLLKSRLPDLRVIAGNVATPEAVRELHALGADGLRVGIGAGSICTTRIVAGVGVPQFQAVLDCCTVANELGIPTIADGGIRSSGDIVKCLAAGASSVMLGNMFAGCEESPGEIEIYRNRAYKVYRGMGSIGALKQGSSDRYMQVKEAGGVIVPEGVEGRVPFKGSLNETMNQLVGGLRSGMGYVGAEDLKALRTDVEFLKITNAGLRESHPHDISITKEPPNYTSPWASSDSE